MCLLAKRHAGSLIFIGQVLAVVGFVNLLPLTVDSSPRIFTWTSRHCVTLMNLKWCCREVYPSPAYDKQICASRCHSRGNHERCRRINVTGILKGWYIEENTELGKCLKSAGVCVYIHTRARTHTQVGQRFLRVWSRAQDGLRGSAWSVMHALFRSVSAPSRGVTDRHGSVMAGPAFTGAHGTWITSRLREDASSSSSLSSSSSAEKPRKRRAFNLVRLRQPTAPGNNNTPFVISGHIKHICSNCSRGNDIRDGEWWWWWWWRCRV